MADPQDIALHEGEREEEARRLDNTIIGLCVVWIVLSVAPFAYDGIRSLVAPGTGDVPISAPAGIALPELNTLGRLAVRVVGLLFYLAAWRLVLLKRPPGGVGLLIGFGVFYLVAGAALAFLSGVFS